VWDVIDHLHGSRRQGGDGAASRPVPFDMPFDVAEWKSGGAILDVRHCWGASVGRVVHIRQVWVTWQGGRAGGAILNVRHSTLLGCRCRVCRPRSASVGGHRLRGLGVHCAGVEVAMVSVVLGAIEVEEGGGGGARGRTTSLSRFESMCWQFDVGV
jgi:hypothetical protein